MGDVIKFNGKTKLDLPANDVLNGAIDKLETAVIVGFDEDGDLYIASTMSSIPEMLWHLKCLEIHLNSHIEGD